MCCKSVHIDTCCARRRGSGTQLDRPGDVKASDSAEDEVIEEDHTPADIDPAVRAMLEKMMGGGGGSGNDKQ